MINGEYENISRNNMSDSQMGNNVNYTSVNAPVNNITDSGDLRYYFTCDGKKCETMDQVMQYNQMYYEKMMKNSSNYENGRHI